MAYDNRGYTCISDGVRGGILDLVPIEGAMFIHHKWNIVDACVPRDLIQAKRLLGIALYPGRSSSSHRQEGGYYPSGLKMHGKVRAGDPL